MTLTLVTGGVCSGKSRWAESRAEAVCRNDVLYVATAEPGDAEMVERIERHRARRPTGWSTAEVPFDLPELIRAQAERPRTLLVDCVTLWLSNLMTGGASGRAPLQGEALRSRVDDLIDALSSHDGHAIVVTNEVGLGGVPVAPLARQYGEALGRLNVRLAREADVVVLMVAGRALLLPPDAAGQR